MKYTILLFVLFMGCRKATIGHQCKWNHCPYKGVIENKAAVKAYVGEEGTDAYYIDILHLENPTLEYDDLETLLITYN